MPLSNLIISLNVFMPKSTLMKKLIILLGILFSLQLLSSAQEVSNLQIELQGKEIVVHFSLNSPNADGLFEIGLYGSHDDFNTPLKMVSGDVGEGIRSGTTRKVIWAAANELGNDYKGRVSIELRARYYVPFVKIIKPVDAKAKLHRGKVSNIEWSGGNSSTTIRIDLLKDGQRLRTLASVPNTGLYSWNISTKTKTGANYSLILTDSRNAQDAVKTGTFSIKPKISTGLKIGAFLAIGVATYFLIPKPESDIPDPPPLPN